jgi:thiol-disulfide isomerase/thioredoxin
MNPLIVAGAGAALFWLFGRNGPNTASMGARVDLPTMRMFHVDWCGHCRDAKPEFTKLLDLNNVGNKPVRFELVNAEENKELAADNGVQSYPTFVLNMPSGAKKEYTGERTADAIKQFVQTAL